MYQKELNFSFKQLCKDEDKANFIANSIIHIGLGNRDGIYKEERKRINRNISDFAYRFGMVAFLISEPGCC